MKRLVRLYPRAWRERYGAELEALLSETGASPRVIVDVLVAALRAHHRDLRERRHARGDGRFAAWAAFAGGTLWAATFAIGSQVEWGRYGRDLGFPILAGAAWLLLIAQLSWAARSRGRERRPAWLSALITLAGGLVLLVAVVAAIVLEPPLRIRLPAHPSDIWDRAMLLVVAGSGVAAALRCGAGPARRDRLAGAVAAIAAGVLAIALFVPFEANVILQLAAEDGSTSGGGYLQLLAPVGWFVMNPVVVAAGVAFGVAWVALGWQPLGDPGVARGTGDPLEDVAHDR